MKSSITRWLVVLLILGLMGGLGYVGMLYMDYKKLSENLTAELQRANAKITAFQDRVREQKAQLSWLEQSKRTLEGQVAGLKKDLESKTEELAQAVVECETKYQAQIEALTMDYEGRIKVLTENRDAYKAALAKSRDDNQELRARNLALSQAKSEVENTLADYKGRYAMAVSHNRRLTESVQELLVKYRDKSVKDVLAQRDPFTQMEKIELEGIMQKYKRVVRDTTLSESGEQ